MDSRQDFVDTNITGTADEAYLNARTRTDLGWQPKYEFGHAIASLLAQQDFRSALAQPTGAKSYHDAMIDEEPCHVEEAS